jgi:hypothetical protein
MGYFKADWTIFLAPNPRLSSPSERYCLKAPHSASAFSKRKSLLEMSLLSLSLSLLSQRSLFSAAVAEVLRASNSFRCKLVIKLDFILHLQRVDCDLKGTLYFYGDLMTGPSNRVHLFTRKNFFISC